MTNKNLGERVHSIFELLSDLEEQERERILASVLSLFGKEIYPNQQRTINTNTQKSDFLKINSTEDNSSMDVQTAKDFFSLKNPQTKGEALAVAARFLEITKSVDSVSKTDLENVFKEARRNFDSSNFIVDIKNATYQSKFFLGGEAKNLYKLSFFGQEYVDLLPNRESVKSLRKPGNSKKKAVTKKES